MNKKTFEISNIHSNEEINALCLALNEKEQVSHIKINKDNIVFCCIDIEALMSTIQSLNKDYIVKEVIDGQKRQYDFAKRVESRHYFMFRNMMTEDDIYVLVERISLKDGYEDVKYDQQNKILMVTTNQKDPLSRLRKELFKINPTVEIFEHRKPIRSQDVFNQKYLKSYVRIAILLVLFSLAIITSKDRTMMTPICWFLTMLVLGESLMKDAFVELKQGHLLKQNLLVFLGMIMGIVSGAYVETCIAVVLYHYSTFFLNHALQHSLKRIDETVEMPEKGIKIESDKEKEISLYEFEVGDLMVIYPGTTVTIPGIVEEGVSQLNTYSNTSTYQLKDVQKGDQLFSGDINVGKVPLYIRVSETYESSNFIELMNIASVAPTFESKLEKYTKKISKFYTPFMVILAFIVGVALPIADFREYKEFIHVGAILLVISGVLSSEQSTSLGVLAGFAKAFESGIIIESSLGLDSLNAAQTIVYDRFDGVEVSDEELDLFKKLSHMGRNLVIFNDGPVALENDQYMIYNDLTVEEKLEKMDTVVGPVAYIGDSFKDIQLLQKSFVGISRGGLADSKVVENSDIVLIDSHMNRIFEMFLIARKMRTGAIVNNILTLVMKFAIIVAAIAFDSFAIWLAILIEILVGMLVMRISTYILE